MQSKTMRSAITLAIAALMLVGMAFASMTGYFSVPSVGAQAESPLASPSAGPHRSITVVGEGKVNISPDIARVQIGVDTMRKSVQEASAENREILEAILEALREQGIAENDIQTSGFSVFTERYGPDGPLADDNLNYRVSNSVRIVVRDLDTVGEVLDAAIDAGANNIYGVEFALDDIASVQSDVRGKAVEDAQARAAELAELTGVSVGRVLSISEVVGGGLFPAYDSRMMAMGGGGTSIAPGELEIMLHLQIVYELVD